MTLMYIDPNDPNEITPHRTKQLDSPIIDEIKESQFSPVLQAFSITNARIRENDSYWVELFIQYGTKSPPLEIYMNNYINNAEVLKFLKNLHNSTFNLIQFIERHSLISKTHKLN